MKRVDAATFNGLRDIVEMENPLYVDAIGKAAKGITKWVPRDIPPYLRLWVRDGPAYLVPWGAHPRRAPASLSPDADWLRPYQREAAQALLDWDCGVVLAPCGAGKTAIGVGVLQSLREGLSLVLVHTSELRRQWVERLKDKGISALSVSGARELQTCFDLGPMLDGVLVATVQSWRDVRRCPLRFACVIVDECHHVPSKTFTDLLPMLDAERVYGLTATPVRKDGMQVVMPAYLGPTRYEVDRRSLVEGGQTLVPRVSRVDTGAYTMSSEFGEMVAELTVHRHRNGLIVAKVKELAAACPLPQLVLTSRVDHAELLGADLAAAGIEARVVVGKVGKAARAAALGDIETGRARVLVATQLADEGLDLPMLWAVHLTLPARGDTSEGDTGGIIEQRAGRVCRPWNGKTKALVIDYVDDDSLMISQWRSRHKVYRRLGWPVQTA